MTKVPSFAPIQFPAGNQVLQRAIQNVSAVLNPASAAIGELQAQVTALLAQVAALQAKAK